MYVYALINLPCLNYSSSVRVNLKDYPCHVNSTHSSSSRITCTTSQAIMNETVGRLQVMVDNAVRGLQDDNLFQYMPDPTIVEIKPFKSFVSGGRMITVHGTHLDAIQSPEMVVYTDQHSKTMSNRTVSLKSGTTGYFCECCNNGPCDFTALTETLYLHISRHARS